MRKKTFFWMVTVLLSWISAAHIAARSPTWAQLWEALKLQAQAQNWIQHVACYCCDDGRIKLHQLYNMFWENFQIGTKCFKLFFDIDKSCFIQYYLFPPFNSIEEANLFPLYIHKNKVKLNCSSLHPLANSVINHSSKGPSAPSLS